MKTIELQYNTEGQLYFRNVRTELFGSGFLSKLQKEIEELTGPAVRQILYNATKESSLQEMHRYKKKYFAHKKVYSPKKQFSFFFEEVPQRGLGVISLKELNLETLTVLLHVDNCFNAQSYTVKTKKPVCFAMSGMFAGVAESIFAKDMICTETKCTAMGDKHCEFVINEKKGGKK